MKIMKDSTKGVYFFFLFEVKEANGEKLHKWIRRKERKES